MIKEEVLIKFNDVHVSFGEQHVHKGVSFEIKEREVITLLGPSGTGKTVILKLILGLLAPSKGEVSVLGYDIHSTEEIELRKIRRNIGMLFQGAALFDSLNVYENIAFPLREAKTYTEDEIEKIVEEKLSLVNLPGTQRKLPVELSGGQKKRVGLARALATSPKVLLFDEPTTGLDPTSRNMIDELILCLKKDLGITSVVITHDMESAKNISDRLILFGNGKIIADGLAKTLWQENKDIMSFSEGKWGRAS